MDAAKAAAMEKILKLLELGKEDNGAFTAEQQAANEMAAKLMAKYTIDFSELRAAGKKGNNVFENHKVDPLDVVYCDWEAVLANCIAKTFDCKLVSSKYPVWHLNFMGTKSDLEITIFFYRHLRRTVCRKAELEYPRNKANQETYAFGMVRTISERLGELYKKREEFIPSDCRDLVIVKKDQLDGYVKSQFPSLRTSRARKLKGSSEAYSRGALDGKSVGLNRPIGHSSGSTRAIA